MTAIPTDQALAEMQSRCEAATPARDDGLWDCVVTEAEDAEDGFWCSGPTRETFDAARIDRDFIAHTRTDLSRLIAAMKELRAEVARLTEELSGCRDAKIRAQSSGDQTRAEVERLRKVEAAARAYRSHFGHEAFRSYVRSEELNVLDDILAGRGPGET